MRRSTLLIVFCCFVTLSHAQLSHPLVKTGAEVKRAAEGFTFTEGPISDKQGNVYFTDQPNDRILKYDLSGQLTTYMQPAGRANGLYIDRKGNLWACADEKTELWKISPKKKKSVVLGRYQNAQLNGPNDLWIHPNGDVYFTDPFYARPWWDYKTPPQPIKAVYRVPKGKGEAIRVAEDFNQPNGIVGSPDGRMLYVADIGANKTYKFTILPDGRLSERVLFCEQGSDGMTLDEQGNLYLTHREGVLVYNPKGERMLTIPTGENWTANVCFGGKDLKTLFITASKGLYTLEMNVRGVNHP